MRLLDPKDVVPVDLGGGDTVYVKRRMSYGDNRRITAALRATDEYLLLLLDINVVGWAGPGFLDAVGSPVPVSREMLDRLDPADAERIIEAINAQNPPRASKEGTTEVPFATPSSAPSPMAAPSQHDSSSSGSSSASAGPSAS